MGAGNERPFQNNGPRWQWIRHTRRTSRGVRKMVRMSPAKVISLKSDSTCKVYASHMQGLKTDVQSYSNLYHKPFFIHKPSTFQYLYIFIKSLYYYNRYILACFRIKLL